jgi:hypothetical protein
MTNQKTYETQVTYKPLRGLYKVTADIDYDQEVTITIIPWEYEPIKYVNVFDMTKANHMDVINSLSGLVDISIAEYFDNPRHEKYQDSNHKVRGE